MERVIGKEAAVKFIEDNCTFNKRESLERLETIGGRWNEEQRKKFEPLAVDGVSELVDVYAFYYEEQVREHSGTPAHWYIDTVYPALRIIKSGEVFTPYQRSYGEKKFGLSPLEPNAGRLDTFRFEESEPNYIGKATEKKLNEWAGYLHRKRDAEQAFISAAEAKNRRFKEAVQKNFPDATLRVDKDGWLIECYFVHERIRYHYSGSHNGMFYRDIRVAQSESDVELLGIEQ